MRGSGLSYRSAIIGSTCGARREGTMLAATVTPEQQQGDEPEHQ